MLCYILCCLSCAHQPNHDTIIGSHSAVSPRASSLFWITLSLPQRCVFIRSNLLLKSKDSKYRDTYIRLKLRKEYLDARVHQKFRHEPKSGLSLRFRQLRACLPSLSRVHHRAVFLWEVSSIDLDTCALTLDSSKWPGVILWLFQQWREETSLKGLIHTWEKMANATWSQWDMFW